MHVSTWCLRASVALFACFAGAASFAQNYPNHPVRLIVASGPGGSVDFIGRILSPRLASALGQPFVVDNKAGAAGNLATGLAARAPADGYTLLLTATSHSTNLNLYAKLPYDTIKDFAPITLVNKNLFGLSVAANSPINNLGELIAAARSSKKQLNFSSAGSGQANHLGTELLKAVAAFEAVHVPYKSMADATVALIGGQVDFAILSLSSVMPQAKAGKVKIIALTAPNRSAIMPNVPTMSESGLPGFELSGWQGLLAPAGTPKEIIDLLHREVVKIIRQPDVITQLTNIATEPIASTPQEFAAFINSEVLKWEKVIKQSGAKPD